jgi:tetratricopeptide (TPR) repeat protein
MSTSSSDQSDRIGARLARAGDLRNGHPAAAPELSPGESDRRPRAVPDLPQDSLDDRERDERLAREMRHQEVIEASFDRAEAYGRVGDFERALEWLDRAAELSGGLPPAYRTQRARWALTAAVRPTPAGGDRRMRLARAGR